MILQIHLVKSNGDTVYGRSYETSPPTRISAIPAHVKACATLYQSSSSTSRDRIYTLEQDGLLWGFLFFDAFVFVFLGKAEDNFSTTKKMFLSLGKEISSSYGDIINSWSGSISDFEDINALVDRYVNWDLGAPSKKELKIFAELIDSVLERHDVAYAGIIDARGSMLVGNIPENHVLSIKNELSDDAIAPSRDLVPTSIEIQGHEVQLLRVQSLCIVAASYPDTGRFPAVKAVDEIAHEVSTLVKVS
ncbi:MAG: hypothetical protein EAX81_00395 [Candidatus Thorarchaeota archaeon]|nr:hypothetical protein [Candidatus Thorarchaeota archaeon]